MSFFRRRKPRTHISVFGRTDVGRAREHNEDTFLVADLTEQRSALSPEVQEHDIGARGSLFMVADGMGGAAAGEVASAMAAETIYNYMIDAWPSASRVAPEQFALRLREAVERTNAEIHARAKERPELRGMGTTVTVAGVLGDQVYLTQVGDSRAYLVRSGEAVQLTKDQSLMQRLVDAGEITEEEAERSERKNIILQALGPEDRVRVDLTFQSIRRGDALVICSDGLSGVVSSEEIAESVSRGNDLETTCAELIALANERGGPDNITVIVARFGGNGLDSPIEGEAVGRQVFPQRGSAATTGPVAAQASDPPPTPQGMKLVAVTATAAILIALVLALVVGLGW